MTINPPLVWYKEGIDKEDLIKSIRSRSIVLDRLKEILHQRLTNYHNKEISESYYDNPAWAYKQAHLNGAKKEIEFLLSLFDFTETP